MDNKRIETLISAARKSTFNMKKWLQFLNEQMDEAGFLITQEETSFLYRSNHLAMWQKVILKSAAHAGSYTQQYLISLKSHGKADC